MAVGAYATEAGLRLRLRGPNVPAGADSALMAEICGEVNDFVETVAERVLAPVPTFSTTVIGDEGDSEVTLGSAGGLAAGDDLLLGLLSGNHEHATVLTISPNLTQAVDDWAAETGYSLNDLTQPTSPNGHTYRCVQAGDSGEEEPTFSTDGSAFADATIIWLDLGPTDATVRVRLPLLHDYSSAPCQRILVADGIDAVEKARCLFIATGVLALVGLEYANAPDRTWKPVDPVDFYLQPGRASLRPGWPQTEVWLSSRRTYPKARQNVRLVGPGPCVEMDDEPLLGFPRIPEAVRTVAYNVAAARWQMKASGGVYEVAPGTDQVQVGQFILTKSDYITLQDFARGWTFS